MTKKLRLIVAGGGFDSDIWNRIARAARPRYRPRIVCVEVTVRILACLR